MNNRMRFKFGTGIPSIILIFMTLCIAIICVLILTNVHSNYALSIKSSDYIASYYQADSNAQNYLYKLNSDYSCNNPNRNDTVIEKLFKINDKQDLYVRFSLKNDYYIIEAQKVVLHDIWEYELYEEMSDD